MTQDPTVLKYSVSNMVFVRGKAQPLLLLGVRGEPAASIPELGQYCLIGGFNTVCPPLSTFEQIADAHLHSMLGLGPLAWDLFNGFQHCEFPLEAGPLKIDGQDVQIKRVAFMRAIIITEDTAKSIRPQGKLSGVKMFSWDEYQKLEQSDQCSFPYQALQVHNTFWRYGCAVD